MDHGHLGSVAAVSGRWISAQEALAAFDQPVARMRERPATIPCGLLRSSGKACPEMFFNAEGRDMHWEDDHQGWHPADVSQATPEPVLPPRRRRPRRMWWDADAPERRRETA